MLGHKMSLNKFKKIEVISSIFSHNSLKLEINGRRKTVKFTNTWIKQLSPEQLMSQRRN